MKTFICPTCVKQLNYKIRYWHTRTCAKRPDDDELREDRENKLNYAALAKKYDVSHDTAKVWCVELGIDGRISNNRSGDKIKVYPELAPMFQETSKCEGCEHFDFCISHQREWVKCEAPDQEQLDGWRLGN